MDSIFINSLVFITSRLYSSLLVRCWLFCYTEDKRLRCPWILLTLTSCTDPLKLSVVHLRLWLDP